jgi:uncharacterized protein (TIGR00255 family)
MIRSMTGFGHGAAESDGISIWAEVSSLNHRYLDINLRLPSLLASFESELRKFIQAGFERGRISVFLSSEGNLPEASEVEFNRHLAQQYIDQVREFAVESDLNDDLSLSSILRLSTLWTSKRPRPEDMERLLKAAKGALQNALEQLTKMREREGATIWADLSDRLDRINGTVDEIKQRAPIVVEEYRQKLKERIDSLLPQNFQLDDQRLLAEVALFAERADITEEIVRIGSHVEQFRVLAGQENNVGRRLDFLLQEMFREITTIGSKARDATISHAVVEVKGLLEKMREQVQNVE